MSALNDAEKIERSLQKKALLLALSGYIALAIGIEFNFRFSPTTTNLAESIPPSLEAEILPHDEPSKLKAISNGPQTHAVKPEPTVALKPSSDASAQSKSSLKPMFDTSNETTAAPPRPSTHGPVVTYSPTPKIPAYLKNQAFSSHVLIEFEVSSGGQSTPTLIGSSGNEELDALALKNARTWIFQAAEKNGIPTASKVRLRINFDVE